MIVLPDEDPKEFQARSSALQEYFQPVGMAENELVNRIASLFWRLQRTTRIEASILTKNYFREKANRADDRANEFVEGGGSIVEELLNEIKNPPGTVVNEHEHSKAKQEAEVATQESNRELTIIGDAYLYDVTGNDGLTKLSRHETTLQRNLSRNIQDLQGLQAARRGKAGTLPGAEEIDVTVSKPPILQRLP
jgi:hypothetical protein